MNSVLRLGFAPLLEGRRTLPRALAAAVVTLLGLLAACGGGAKSDAQIASDALSAGLRAQAQGRTAEAAADYKNVLAHDARNKFAYYDLGLIQQNSGQSAAAEQNYRACLQVDPNFAPALYNLAILRTGPSPLEAEQLYRHAISVQPNNAPAHLNLGFLLRSLGRADEGNTELRTAVALDASLAQRIAPGTLATPAPPTSTPRPTPTTRP